MLFPFIILIILILAIGADWALYKSLKKYISPKAAKIGLIWIVLTNLYWMAYIGLLVSRTDTVQPMPIWTLIALIIFVSKDVFMLLWLFFVWPFQHKKTAPFEFFTIIFLSLIVGECILYGGLIGRYKVHVERVEVNSKRLPQFFDGYKIAQISDFHVGSLTASDTTFVDAVVDSILSLKPDMICFTGDIVNQNSQELKPFMGRLSRLNNTRHRVFAVMGNHDYSDYSRHLSAEEHQADVDSLRAFMRDMGWTLLDNQGKLINHRSIVNPSSAIIHDEKICIIGVENIGEPPFSVYGNLDDALADAADQGRNDSTYTILLSHNPQHWRQEVLQDSAFVDLTLSGHTHAMQIQIGHFSPSQWRYKEWGGLYNEGQKYLYVNKGVGTVGFPMRIGAKPEITLITLTCDAQ